MADPKYPDSVTIPELLISPVGNYAFTPAQWKKLLKKHESIMSIKGRREVYYYFLDHIAGTGALIMQETGLSEQGAYSHMKWLYQNEFIMRHGKLKSVKKGGPKPFLYALPGATSEQIARARIKIDKNYRQAYTHVLELTQIIFEDVVDAQIQYSKIVSVAKRRNKGFDFVGIADQVARELHGKGIKVWR
ncbi:hypothetical protein ES703_59016 [subsurface metagenome]